MSEHMPVGKSAEWLVLTLVILATLSIGFEPETETVEEFDVTHMSGTITLATRASMDALGLDDYDRDAKANLDIQVQSVVSDQCENCTGVLMQGPVNVTELKGGGTGRVQANIEVVHIRENIGDHMIAREWLSFEWDVIGGDDFTWDIMISHEPPLWQPENRFNAGFSESESRTGPWILIEAMLDGARNVQGCLPGRSMPCLVSQPDIEMTSVLEPAQPPIEIPHPSEWMQIENVTSTNQAPSKTEQIRDVLDLGDATTDLQAWCTNGTQDINAAQAWAIEGGGSTAVSPMGIYLEALALPSTSFTPVTGTWTEIETEDFGCAALVDENGFLRIGISIHEH
jgi:hypothetical protein